MSLENILGKVENADEGNQYFFPISHNAFSNFQNKLNLSAILYVNILKFCHLEKKFKKINHPNI